MLDPDPARAPDLDDEAWLDQAFDAALTAASEGQPFGLEPWIAGRPHLRERITDTVASAKEVAVQQPVQAPVVPGFALGPELGRGASGTVFRAVRTSDGMAVALKVMAAARSASPAARQRFRAEAAALRKLRHPHIVALHDVVETPELLAFAMDLVPGRSVAQVLSALVALTAPPTLADVSRALGADPLPDASLTAFWLRIGAEAADALQAVHDAGLLHRDLKPGNLLVRRDGRAFLSDFGLARDPDWSLHTSTGAMLGTPAYAAPEQLRGEALDARTDVYGLGALLYEAFTRRRPFAAQHLEALVRDAEAGAVVPPRRLDPSLPPGLEAVLLTALAPEPERRYPTAATLALDLQRLLRLQPVQARAPGWWLRTRRRLRQHRGAVTAAGLAVVLVCAAFAFGLWQLAERAAVPGRIADLVRHARLQLLAADTGSDLWLARASATPPQRIAVRADRLRTVADGYAAARALGELPAHAAAEAEVLALARQLHRGETLDAAADPLLTAYAAAVAARIQVQRIALPDLANARASSRRSLGLLAYLCADASSAVVAWDGLDFAEEPDPLLDGALGLSLLVQDQPARAWPRLLRAAEALPEAGCLTAAVADAALRCGDVHAAQRFLAKAQRLGHHDRAATLRRVEGDLLAARGDAAGAIAAYRSAIAADNPLARQRLVDLFERAGRWAEAYAALHPDATDAATVQQRGRCLRRWWLALAAEQRWQEVQACFGGATTPTGGLLPRLLERLDAAGRGAEEIDFQQQCGTGLRLLRFVASDGRSLLQTLTNRAMTASRPSSPRHPLPLPFAIALAALHFATAPATSQAPQWVQRTPAQSPPPLTDHALVYDAARQQTVLFGGYHYGTGADFGQTWIWDGTDWQQRQPANSPIGRAGLTMVYDSARAKVLMFGGYNHTGIGHRRDLWEWDGTNWTLVSANGPPRERHQAAYDPVRARMVVFGGLGPPLQTPLGDTWEWDGANWIQATPALSPPAGSSGKMVYDPVRNRCVLALKAAVASTQTDTWEWDGANWQQRTPMPPLPSRSDFGMAWDTTRQRLLLFGGQGDAPLYLRTDTTWSWDGSHWTELCCSAVRPPARRAFAMAYDSVRNVLVIACGDADLTTAGMLNDTWELSLSSVATATPFGTGCPGSQGTPNLLATSLPVVGTTFGAQLTNVAPGAAIFTIGWSNTQWSAFPLPLPLGPFGLDAACTNYTSIDFSVWTFHGGVADYSLPIPCDAAFYGTTLFLQGASLDPAIPSSIPIAVSNGLQVTFGQ